RSGRSSLHLRGPALYARSQPKLSDASDGRHGGVGGVLPHLRVRGVGQGHWAGGAFLAAQRRQRRPARWPDHGPQDSRSTAILRKTSNPRSKYQIANSKIQIQQSEFEIVEWFRILGYLEFGMIWAFHAFCTSGRSPRWAEDGFGLGGIISA